MDAKFWLDKWTANQIGFHEDHAHPMLTKHWTTLSIDATCAVFVPLCGKSKDMLWLRERGHHVVGVELSAIALEAFFTENGIDYEQDKVAGYSRFRGDGYTLLAGDFFSLNRDVIGPFGAIYDRAALIALPPEMRRRYVKHLRELSNAGTQGLLVTVDYPAEEISPPPFIVVDKEVTESYACWCTLNALGSATAQVKGLAARETAFNFEVS